MEDNRVQQQEEIEALIAIYGNEWKRDGDSDTSYQIQVTKEVALFINFSADYPASSPPEYQLLAPTLNSGLKSNVHASFKQIYSENQGTPVVYQWIERLKEIIGGEEKESPVENEAKTECVSSTAHSPPTYEIIHGPLIRDRRSTFQGHVCKAFHKTDIEGIRNQLFANKKIAQATHNILAYRVVLANGALLQDCDDDGEMHAGGRLLHLLQIMNLTNVAVIVTRWFGGTLLGPDRFRHINNAARQVLHEANFV